MSHSVSCWVMAAERYSASTRRSHSPRTRFEATTLRFRAVDAPISGAANHVGLHVWAQRLGHHDAAVLLLILLEDGHDGAPHRERRAVQGVHEAQLFRLRAVADLRSSR